MSLGRRDGATFDPDDQDAIRLAQQGNDVWNAMNDGLWHRLDWISKHTGHPTQSVSARLRDFRKARFGTHTVERRRIIGGIHVYRLLPNRNHHQD